MVTVRQQTELGSKQWGIYENGQLVEGGFFSRAAAESAVRGCSVCGSRSHGSAQCPHRFGGANFNHISNPDGV